MGNGYDTLNKNTRLKVIWEKKSYIELWLQSIHFYSKHIT